MNKDDFGLNEPIAPNAPIEILPVANGFVARGNYDLRSDRRGGTLVFESYAGLSEWLAKHFTHRASTVCADSPTPSMRLDEASREMAAARFLIESQNRQKS